MVSCCGATFTRARRTVTLLDLKAICSRKQPWVCLQIGRYFATDDGRERESLFLGAWCVVSPLVPSRLQERKGHRVAYDAFLELGASFKYGVGCMWSEDDGDVLASRCRETSSD